MTQKRILEIPAILFGHQATVERQIRRWWQESINASGPNWEAFAELRVVRTDELIMLNEPANVRGPRYFVGVLAGTYLDLTPNVPSHVTADVVDRLLASSWGTLCLSASMSARWLKTRRTVRLRYLESVLRDWDLIHAVGRRYCGLALEPAEFWQLPSAFRIALKQETGQVTTFHSMEDALSALERTSTEAKQTDSLHALRKWLLAALEQHYGGVPPDILNWIAEASFEQLDRWAGAVRAYPQLDTFVRLVMTRHQSNE